jgi:hypothetical protein
MAAGLAWEEASVAAAISPAEVFMAAGLAWEEASVAVAISPAEDSMMADSMMEASMTAGMAGIGVGMADQA